MSEPMTVQLHCVIEKGFSNGEKGRLFPYAVSRKTCSSCFATIYQKNKVAAKKVTLDRKWGERVLKNRNAGRVVDSAHIAVKKLSALGYVPILFFGKKDKASGKWVADVVTHLPPTEDNLKIVATMRKAYNFVLIKEGRICVI
ncbi:hypothetical protein DPX16_20767 [Anabarilius grahami]|uniref:Uncharacterized protein n=1 Tax=Anabarilius grahami TaxID=495550 RepID=A0A3N0ZAI2_ANAGA|nr:hypothetical protein DPX16_20767 [Anabarilius grahami]